MDSEVAIAPTILSYDDTVAYEEQVSFVNDAASGSAGGLKNRIGNTRVYLLSETSVAKTGRKRKHVEDEVVVDDDEDVEMDEDLSIRSNAILFTGTPISHLPTARMFAYTTHFDVKPMCLEWVDDNTCILVFPSKLTARAAYKNLLKSSAEDLDDEGYIAAKSVPMALWPPEERINKSLGKGDGLKGLIRMRWARVDDVKVRNARQQSQFYKKHGEGAGKEKFGERESTVDKRRRREGDDDVAARKAQLDDELDNFLAEDNQEQEESRPPSPPSKMRSDYIANDGKTLLERTSLLRLHPNQRSRGLQDRLIEPGSRRRRDGVVKRDLESRLSIWGHDLSDAHSDAHSDRSARGGDRRRGDRKGGRKVGNEGSGGEPRQRKTQQELDDELEAFLNERD